MNKILAINDKGELTYCTSPEELRGKGRCNHIFHKNNNETEEEFLNRTSIYKFVSKDELESVNDVKANISVGGAQDKWWSKDHNYLYKIDTNDPSRGLIQWNGLSEDIISNFLIYIGKENNIENAKYETIYVNGKLGCSSKNFIKNNENLIEFGEILDNNDMEYLTDIENEDFDSKFNYLCQKIKDKTNGTYDPENDLIKLIKLDIIIMNADRHYGNIGLIFNKDTNQFKFSPIYDNGQCLLAENIYNNIDAYGYQKFELPGLSMFGMFPMKNYIKFALKHSNKNNDIKINLDQMEEFIENYQNKYYDEEKVEKVKWLLYDNLDVYNEIGVINNED